MNESSSKTTNMKMCDVCNENLNKKISKTFKSPKTKKNISGEVGKILCSFFNIILFRKAYAKLSQGDKLLVKTR